MYCIKIQPPTPQRFRCPLPSTLASKPHQELKTQTCKIQQQNILRQGKPCRLPIIHSPSPSLSFSPPLKVITKTPVCESPSRPNAARHVMYTCIFLAPLPFWSLCLSVRVYTRWGQMDINTGFVSGTYQTQAGHATLAVLAIPNLLPPNTSAGNAKV